MFDIKSKIKIAPSLVPINRTAAGNGAGVDLAGFNAACVSFVGGAIGGTTPTFTFGVQESADNTTFTDVAAVDLRGVAPVVTAAGAIAVVGYAGNLRYIRAILKTVAGTTPTLDCAANVILGSPRNAPAV